MHEWSVRYRNKFHDYENNNKNGQKPKFNKMQEEKFETI